MKKLVIQADFCADLSIKEPGIAITPKKVPGIPQTDGTAMVAIWFIPIFFRPEQRIRKEPTIREHSEYHRYKYLKW